MSTCEEHNYCGYAPCMDCGPVPEQGAEPVGWEYQLTSTSTNVWDRCGKGFVDSVAGNPNFRTRPLYTHTEQPAPDVWKERWEKLAAWINVTGGAEVHRRLIGRMAEIEAETTGEDTE